MAVRPSSLWTFVKPKRSKIKEAWLKTAKPLLLLPSTKARKKFFGDDSVFLNGQHREDDQRMHNKVSDKNRWGKEEKGKAYDIKKSFSF